MPGPIQLCWEEMTKHGIAHDRLYIVHVNKPSGKYPSSDINSLVPALFYSLLSKWVSHFWIR